MQASNRLFFDIFNINFLQTIFFTKLQLLYIYTKLLNNNLEHDISKWYLIFYTFKYKLYDDNSVLKFGLIEASLPDKELLLTWLLILGVVVSVAFDDDSDWLLLAFSLGGSLGSCGILKPIIVAVACAVRSPAPL